MDSAIWLVITVIFAVIEASTAQLVCIWFALGAVVAMITAMITDSIIIQLLAFVFATAIFLALTRKLVHRLTDVKKSATNVDSLIGKTAILLEEADNLKGTGTIRLAGTVWSVKSENEEVIAEGTKVIIKKVEGVKLVVNKAE